MRGVAHDPVFRAKLMDVTKNVDKCGLANSRCQGVSEADDGHAVILRIESKRADAGRFP